MTDAKRHKNDSADACYFCSNFRLVPVEGAAQRAIDNLKIALKVKNGEIGYSDIPTEAAKADMTIDKAEIEKFIGGDQS